MTGQNQNAGQQVAEGLDLDGAMQNAGGAMGTDALAGALAGSQENPNNLKRQIEDPSAAKQMGNPYGGDVVAGTAMEPNDALLSRMTGGQGVPDSAENLQQQGQQGQGVTQDAGQPKFSQEAQGEIDRLKNQAMALQKDALLGKFVRKDERLMRMVGDSMQGTNLNPGVTYQQKVNQQVSIKERLGLPDSWEPIPEEYADPSSMSFRYLQETMKDDLVGDITQQMHAERQQEALNMQAHQARVAFLSKPDRTQDDLDGLMEWLGNMENFTLERLWAYKNMESLVNQAAMRTGRQDSQNADKQFVGSIAAVSGGGAAGTLEPEVQLQAGMLNMAKKNRNPLIGK